LGLTGQGFDWTKGKNTSAPYFRHAGAQGAAVTFRSAVFGFLFGRLHEERGNLIETCLPLQERQKLYAMFVVEAADYCPFGCNADTVTVTAEVSCIGGYDGSRPFVIRKTEAEIFR
jgi:hypothetical protein